jgi:predicted TIM-barrel fold metal-dependent hydrolase
MYKHPSRRDLIKAAAGLAGLAGCRLTDKKYEPVDKTCTGGWIDAHVHVWTDDLKSYPIAPGYTKERMRPPRFTPEDLFAHCEPCGVRRINLIQMSYYMYDNSYMLDVMEKYPGRFAGTAIVDIADPNVADSMRRLGSRGVRAFRIYPALAGKKPLDWLKPEGYKTMFKIGADLNQAMSCLINTDSLPELDRMCGLYPQTPVIIDHLCRVSVRGQIDQKQLDALLRMSRHPRVMVKIGAFCSLGSRKPPYDDLRGLIRRVTEAFGCQRCMWETDSPWQVILGTYKDSLVLIRDRCDFLSPRDKEQLLRKTAEDFFFKT